MPVDPQAPSLDRRSDQPAYLQIRRWLEQEIGRGRFAGGKPVPSEPDLAQRFGVSRMTARQAVGELVAAGLLRRERGKGTFVAERAPFKRVLDREGLSLHGSLARQQLELASAVHRQEVVPAEPGVARWLELAPGAPVVRIDRLRLVGAVPLAFQTSWLPAAYFPGLEAADLTRGSLNRLMAERYGLPVLAAQQMVSAISAGKAEAHLLQVPLGAALLSVEKVAFSRREVPVEYVHIVYPPDRYVLLITTPAATPDESETGR